MFNASLSAAVFNEYAIWTASVWLTSPRALTERDVAIMGLGLSGEAGEVMETLEDCIQGAPVQDLVKELGDAAYYCARIAELFKLELPELDTLSIPRSYAGLPAALPHAIELFKQSARANEVLKKQIRDGVLPEAKADFEEKLRRHLTGFLKHWLGIVACTGIAPDDVLAANRKKLLDRLDRGVLNGSGNHR